MAVGIPASEVLLLDSLIAPIEQGIASRVLAKSSGGTVTLFAFGAGDGLSEHTAPFDAMVVVLDGALQLTIGGRAVDAAAGSVVRMPAGIAHAVDSKVASRMLLIMLKEPDRAAV